MVFESQPVTDRCRSWLTAQVGDCSIGSPLSGATTATVVPVVAPHGEYVLKWFTWESFVAEEPERVAHEADGLKIASAAQVPAPRVVAIDPDGEQTGHPAILMTRVGGASLPRPHDWPKQAALAAARLHASAAPVSWSHVRYFPEPFVPDWVSDAGLWHDALTVVADLSDFDATVIHRDLHRWNMHWEDGSLAGIVDWLSVCSGPVGEDVGRVWINEVLEGQPDEGLRFREAYAEVADRSWDLRWELQSAIDMLPAYISEQAVHEWGDPERRVRLEQCVRSALDLL